MSHKHLTALILSLMVLQVYADLALITGSQGQATPDVYVGIDLSYGDVAEAKAMIDQVSSYTNLIVIGTSRITWYPDKVNETFQYAYDKGLSFISLPPSLPNYSFNSSRIPRSDWYDYARNTWGDRLLGFYYLDEPGGRQQDLDQVWTGNLSASESTYADAASRFTYTVSRNLESQRRYADSYKAFTSDYSLYWFDYKAGYDTIFAEFGWNYSRQLNVALCRGAATAQNKDWGAIITWTYTAPPYIESDEELYNDLVLAYDNGAKYIVVFDGNEGWTEGILEDEHLDALQRFWNYTQNNPRKSSPTGDRTAYVLPNAYGFGFRGPRDHIWGLWEADALATNVSISVASLLNDYGENLDIIYEDGLQPNNTYGYSQLIYWDAYALPPPKITVLSPENTTYAVNNVTLTFTVDKHATWTAYSLDGQEQTAIYGNTTLLNLPEGAHSITLFAKDEFETTGSSETIHFNIDPPEPFPVAPVALAVVTVVAVTGLLVYLKKHKRQAAAAAENQT
jgi:hypothetical protein